jgi:alkylation response protein AidB-like acyl-CoA dehydrogenase
MELSFTAEQRKLRDDVVAFSRAALNAGVIERDRHEVFPRDLWGACGRMGLLGLPAPERYGGSGLDPVSCAIALEALGYGCLDHGLVFSVGAHIVTSVVALSKFGTEEQKRRYLPGLCDGSLIGAHAVTESDAGSDPFAMRTRAVKEGDGWRINGAKTFVTNGVEAKVIVVFAVTDPATRFHGGVTAFVVERDTAGVSAGRGIEKMGLRTSPICELGLDGAWVADGAVLGGVGGGAGVFTHAMDWERVGLFAAHVGQMERLLEQAVAHARTRQSGGRAIGSYQAVAHKIADMKVRLEAARLLIYQAASRLERTRAVSLDASIAKLFVSEALVETAKDVVQIFGGYGYSTEYGVERALRDAVGATIYSGTSEVQRNIIAAWLGL